MLQQFIATKRAYFADLYAHLGRRGVAGNGAVALHALAAITVGECQPLLQLGRGGGGQAVHGYAVAAKLPQERPDEAVPRTGSVHGLDWLDGGNEQYLIDKGIVEDKKQETPTVTPIDTDVF